MYSSVPAATTANSQCHENKQQSN